MLRPVSRILYRSSTATRSYKRAESTSAPLIPKNSRSSTNAAPANDEAQALPGERATPKVETASPVTRKKLRSPADPAADYQRLLEERFGGGEAAALGELVDGKPQGLAKHVKNNMFRLI
ncbi:hypothetical protein JCM11491_004653 [Sporobolomyces phaffii]